MFCLDMALNCLVKSKILFCEGNFETCPESFVQTFCNHALIQECKIPLVWAMLAGKTEAIMVFYFLC